ncbi:unnamed protein product [Arctia plantaginis]|uniref:Uncharacterized protein n=1 Tax=Arctia plantaginis TaxID=874455 RepID=A0A8S1AU92_ARCPL|nr:unnamed protein product [Arctia plantaginis]CAB3248784.1 unnamed protein product [Arctia plantaginis]
MRRFVVHVHMNRHKHNSKDMVSMKSKHKVSCSTPEHHAESPSRDSDSIYDSDTASPVPFLCTQDGAEGETDVVWNFYTPKAKETAYSRTKNSTPVSRRPKRSLKPKLIEKQLPKRRPVRLPQKKTELFQELIELNQNLEELMAKKSQNNCPEKLNSGSEDDVFNDSPEFSPKSRLRSNSLCLRRNVLSSNFVKPDTDAALESDDSINECLIKASQIVEENIINEPIAKRPCLNSKLNNKTLKSDFNLKMNQDSMDAILNSIKLESPVVNKVKKKFDSPKLNNDSFDSLIGNLNDSALEKLTQAPAKTDTMTIDTKLNVSRDSNSWTIKELIVHDDNSPSSKSFFGRHNSMPISPIVTNTNLPSTSGMVFGRYNSMPFGKDANAETGGDSPIRCTQEEIKKKHQLAREKLLAKRLLPFTASQKIVPSTLTSQPDISKKIDEPSKSKEIAVARKFQLRVPSTVTRSQKPPIEITQEKTNHNGSDIKSIIEKKRQEALMKLRRRQVQSKMI